MAKANQTAAPATNFAVLQALMSKAPAARTTTITDLVVDSTAGVVNGTTEVLARSVADVDEVWSTARSIGRVDALRYRADMVARAAARNGVTTEEMLQLLAN